MIENRMGMLSIITIFITTLLSSVIVNLSTNKNGISRIIREKLMIISLPYFASFITMIIFIFVSSFCYETLVSYSNGFDVITTIVFTINSLYQLQLGLMVDNKKLSVVKEFKSAFEFEFSKKEDQNIYQRLGEILYYSFFFLLGLQLIPFFWLVLQEIANPVSILIPNAIVVFFNLIFYCTFLSLESEIDELLTRNIEYNHAKYKIFNHIQGVICLDEISLEKYKNVFKERYKLLFINKHYSSNNQSKIREEILYKIDNVSVKDCERHIR